MGHQYSVQKVEPEASRLSNQLLIDNNPKLLDHRGYLSFTLSRLTNNNNNNIALLHSLSGNLDKGNAIYIAESLVCANRKKVEICASRWSKDLDLQKVSTMENQTIRKSLNRLLAKINTENSKKILSESVLSHEGSPDWLMSDAYKLLGDVRYQESSDFLVKKVLDEEELLKLRIQALKSLTNINPSEDRQLIKFLNHLQKYARENYSLGQKICPQTELTSLQKTIENGILDVDSSLILCDSISRT